MVRELLSQYLNHSRRGWITWSAAGVIGLLVALPAWDLLSEARQQSLEIDSELHATQMSLSNLELMRQKLRVVSQGPDSFQQLMNVERSDRLRERVTKLVQKMGCQVRRLTLSDPAKRRWGVEDDPFSTSAPENADKSNFLLETRQLTVVVDGDLGPLSKLTIALTQLDRFAVPTEMTLRRETVNGHLRLDVNISLFNLVETND